MLELVGRGILCDLICVVCVHVDNRRLTGCCGEVVEEIHPEVQGIFLPEGSLIRFGLSRRFSPLVSTTVQSGRRCRAAAKDLVCVG